MGALIGGLYSTGMTASDLDRALVDLDWQDVFSDRPSRRALSYRKKKDDVRYLPDLLFGVTPSGLRVPGGVTSGGRIVATLEELSPTTANVLDFDDLPTPSVASPPISKPGMRSSCRAAG
jgi:NTE family protein